MKYNILVVDDEEDIRLSIAGLLEDENYEVRVAKKITGVSRPENIKIANGTHASIGIGRSVSRIGKE